jgi:hypothetical protein
MSTHINHHFRIFGSSKDLKQVAETAKNFLDLCPEGKCDHTWTIEHVRKPGNHRVEIWLGTTWHNCTDLLQTLITGLSAELQDIAVDYLQTSDDGDAWSYLYSIRQGMQTLRGHWSCFLWSDAADALAKLKSSKVRKAAALATVTAALTKLAKDPDSYGTITADTFADCIVAAVGGNRNLLDDPSVVKNFVQLDKALASHGWPSNWFDEYDDDDDHGPKMPRKFRVLLESVCLSAATAGKKRAAGTHASL